MYLELFRENDIDRIAIFICQLRLCTDVFDVGPLLSGILIEITRRRGNEKGVCTRGTVNERENERGRRKPRGLSEELSN